MAHLSALLLILLLLSRPPPSCLPFFPPPASPTVYLLFCRPEAGDDLRLLEDGLAGELLQYCHDHQVGGSGQGRSPFPLSCDLSSRLQRWMEGACFWRSFLSFAIYQNSCCALCCVGGNGCRCPMMSDHILLQWLCSKVTTLMYMKHHGGTLGPV